MTVAIVAMSAIGVMVAIIMMVGTVMLVVMVAMITMVVPVAKNVTVAIYPQMIPTRCLSGCNIISRRRSANPPPPLPSTNNPSLLVRWIEKAVVVGFGPGDGRIV